MGEQGETEREGSRVDERSLSVQDGEREQELKVKFSSNIIAVCGASGDRAQEVIGQLERANVICVGYCMNRCL